MMARGLLPEERVALMAASLLSSRHYPSDTEIAEAIVLSQRIWEMTMRIKNSTPVSPVRG